MSSSEGKQMPPHVVIFPLPVQSHLIPMLKLAHILCLSDLHVTFIISESCHRRLLLHATMPATLARYSGFQFRTLPDGVLDDHPCSGEKVKDFLASIENTMFPLFKKMMVEENLLASAVRRPVTCWIGDGMMRFTSDFADEIGIPLISFQIGTVSYLWASFCFPQLLQAQEIPFGEKSMDEVVKSIPGMEGILRLRDLPSFYRVDDVNEALLQRNVSRIRLIVRAQAVLLDTCDDFEAPMVAEMRKHVPRIFSIGPIHEQMKSRLVEKKVEASTITASLKAEDCSCIDWLDGQPRKSVIYVSFGTIAVLTKEQMIELWHGLVNSSQGFLWVVRQDSITGTGSDGKDQVVVELMERSKGKGNGLVVEWAPQEKVLNHPAVGGFLTQGGMNSIWESVVAGVPMIFWPYFVDQMTNSRLVSEVWKIGLDIKDTCDRLVIEKAIRELMEMRKYEFLQRTDEMAKLVNKAVTEGGSSYRNLDAFIQYINSFII